MQWTDANDRRKGGRLMTNDERKQLAFDTATRDDIEYAIDLLREGSTDTAISVLSFRAAHLNQKVDS